MRIVVNGESVEVDPGVTLVALLEQMGKPANHVAIEHNGDILDRAGFAEVALRENDRLEIVHFVGGG